MNIKQFKMAMTVLFEAGVTPHGIGEAGVGKSAAVYQYAEENDYDVVEVRVGLMADAGDLVGIQEFVRDTKGDAFSTRHVLPDWFMKAAVLVEASAKKGRKVIIFCDELSRGHKDLLQAIFELVYDRSLKGTKMRADCQVVAMSNPTTDDYAGSMEFSDDAFQDRFCHIKVEPTLEEFVQYGKTRGKIDTSILDFVQEYNHMLDKEHKPWSLDFVHPSRRSWDRLSKVLNIIEKKPEYKEIELELMFGIVGEKAALAYKSFRDTYIKSIKAKDVLDAYTVNATVKKSVTDAVSKGRPDMIGTLNEEVIKLLEGMKGLTQLQADNLGALVTDLPVELAYSLSQKITASGAHSEAVRNIDGKTPGLWGHEGFVKRMSHIKEERMKIKKMAKESDTSKKKDKNVPF